MSMTLTEKILARAAGRSAVAPGENVWVKVDVLLTHDVCGPGTIGVFEEHFGPDAPVFHPEKVIIIPDHYIFTADPKAHRNIEILREFVRRKGIRHYYDPDFVRGEGMPAPYADPTATSYKGVCHVALPQAGHVRPGEVLLGTDSHTCTHGALGAFATGIGNTEAGFVMGTGRLWLKVPPTLRFVFRGQPAPYVMAKDMILHVIGQIGTDGATYMAMEFAGEAVYSLNVEERMTLCNMAVEAGAKNGIFVPDETARAYIEGRSTRSGRFYRSDPDAVYEREIRIPVDAMEPQVALPHSPDNVRPISALNSVPLDQVFLGSCTNGRLEDLREAAGLIRGRRVAPGIRFIVIPGSPLIYREAVKEGLIETFLEAGGVIGPPCCGPCLGGHMGILAEGEKALSTSNRNFVGRMGHPKSEVYLANPAVAAASAITGYIASPDAL